MTYKSYARDRPQVREEILRRLNAGERLQDICAEAGMPTTACVHGWARKDPAGFKLALRAAYREGGRSRRRVCDPDKARAVLAGLAEGRRLEDVVRGPGMPSLRTFMAWRLDHGWIAEDYYRLMAVREAARREKARARFRPFDPAVAERLYVRLWSGEPLRRVLASDKAFPSLAVLSRWRGEQPQFDRQLRFVLEGWRGKRGREGHLCTPQMIEAIVDGIVQGESLRSLGRRPDMPSERAMSNWVRTRPEFAAAVAQACVDREDWYQDQIFEIELTATPGTMREVRRRTAPLRKQLTRLRKRPGWKARKAAEEDWGGEGPLGLALAGGRNETGPRRVGKRRSSFAFLCLCAFSAALAAESFMTCQSSPGSCSASWPGSSAVSSSTSRGPGWSWTWCWGSSAPWSGASCSSSSATRASAASTSTA